MPDEIPGMPDVEKSIASIAPALAETERQLKELLQKRQTGWIRIMVQISRGRILKSTVESQEIYPGVQSLDENDDPR